MALGAQCAEDGPFFATTPRSVIQNGMAISQDILIMPDWLLIGLMMACLLLLMIILVIGLVSPHTYVQRCVYKGGVILLFIMWQVFLSGPSTKTEHFVWFLSDRKPTVRAAQVWREILDFKFLKSFFNIFLKISVL